ncbi:serine protein kinase RIO [Isoptericola variabilis]|uniref:non-specific serine/threonine protein kinase n=1 Tax=Isoptericola variabilis (strain 225) TaxID=743718 RepID=F6FTQ5_ISOV2|nr:RIO1 family regulatory kinase/ATPase [Isoptericola variabilis]AEG44182.1 RIO-like kinase [Isoptericola variabilis 225]TWH28503.1 RIO kinase 1 [Isoptericola variabilis J7]
MHPHTDHVLPPAEPVDLTEPGPDQRWSTWTTVAKGQRGPEPRPGWVVTSAAALDTELGILKTGKEADVFLVERAVPGDPDQVSLLAAKRYRGREHRQFHRDGEYTDGRRVRRTRDQRAIEDRKSSWGRAVAATQWADAEFGALCALWDAGAPVPYPVQIDGTELLMEFVGTVDDDGVPVAAPRLARARPDAATLAGWFDQVRDAMGVLARLGWAHGDLSPYNVLAHGDRVVVIDLPQVVDLVANPFGAELLHRDCRTMAAWFAGRGLDVDADELFADVYAQAW